MKKFYVLAVALLATVCVNAKVINIDLSKYTPVDAVTPVLDNGELTVSYDLGEWGAGGVVFALDDLDVTELAFEYKGDESVSAWVSFLVYLEDSEGGWWYSNAADLSISSWNAEWEAKNFMPTDVLWESSAAAEPAKPFKALGFLANPASATNASFAIRNVALTVTGDESGLDNITSRTRTTKVIRNGQVLFVRDGKTFNALGTIVAE